MRQKNNPALATDTAAIPPTTPASASPRWDVAVSDRTRFEDFDNTADELVFAFLFLHARY
jgi:hypothetical protein